MSSLRRLQHVDRKDLYTSLEARIQYLHSFLDFNSGTSPPTLSQIILTSIYRRHPRPHPRRKIYSSPPTCNRRLNLQKTPPIRHHGRSIYDTFDILLLRPPNRQSTLRKFTANPVPETLPSRLFTEIMFRPLQNGILGVPR
jgi:hypothetical protein